MDQFEHKASYVIMELCHRLYAAARQKKDGRRLLDLIRELETEFPEAKAEIDRIYGYSDNRVERLLDD